MVALRLLRSDEAQLPSHCQSLPAQMRQIGMLWRPEHTLALQQFQLLRQRDANMITISNTTHLLIVQRPRLRQTSNLRSPTTQSIGSALRLRTRRPVLSVGHLRRPRHRSWALDSSPVQISRHVMPRLVSRGPRRLRVSSRRALRLKDVLISIRDNSQAINSHSRNRNDRGLRLSSQGPSLMDLQLYTRVRRS